MTTFFGFSQFRFSPCDFSQPGMPKLRAILPMVSFSVVMLCGAALPCTGLAQITTDLPQERANSDQPGSVQAGDSGQKSKDGVAVPGNDQAKQRKTDPQNEEGDERSPQTKRILGILPNFRSVSTDAKLPPQSAKQKFLTATDDSFDYSSIFVPAWLAGYSMGTKATPEFGQGAAGYGRYFWHAAVDQTSENYMVEFVVPSIAHQDTRYYTLGRGGVRKRALYSLSRAIVTRSDTGKEEFNVSEVLGAGISSGLSSLYYPSRERSLSSTGTEWALDIAIDAGSFTIKEFWPDIHRWLTHQDKATAPAN